MTIDIADLKAKALLATPEEWKYEQATNIKTGLPDKWYVTKASGRPICAMEFQTENGMVRYAAFIAAANPAVVLELIERLKRAEKDTLDW